jgi:hypothetical protein
MTAPAPPASKGFAIPGRLHVFTLFMTQFMVMILGLGGVVPHWHRQGVHAVILVLGSIVGLIALHLVLGLIGRVVPTRCKGCRGQSHFGGFGWWPFIYRYRCQACGLERRMEVQG